MKLIIDTYPSLPVDKILSSSIFCIDLTGLSCANTISSSFDYNFNIAICPEDNPQSIRLPKDVIQYIPFYTYLFSY